MFVCAYNDVFFVREIFHVTHTNDILEKLIIKVIWCRNILHFTSLTRLLLYAVKSNVVPEFRYFTFCMTE